MYLSSKTILPNTYLTYAAALQAGSRSLSGLTQAVSPNDCDIPQPVEGTADQCCLAWDESTNQIWVMSASANPAGSVEYRNLNHKEQKCSDDTRSLEVNNLLDLDAYELLSLEESIAFRNEFPDSVLTSRFVDRW